MPKPTISGKGDENLRWLESQFGIKVIPRGVDIILSGDPRKVNIVSRILGNIAGLERYDS